MSEPHFPTNILTKSVKVFWSSCATYENHKVHNIIYTHIIHLLNYILFYSIYEYYLLAKP